MGSYPMDAQMVPVLQCKAEDGWSGLAERGDASIGPYQANISMLSGDLSAYSFFVELTQYTNVGGTYPKGSVVAPFLRRHG